MHDLYNYYGCHRYYFNGFVSYYAFNIIMKEKITFLLVRHYNEYHVYSPNTFGAYSWGSNSQISIVKKRNYWYYNKWVDFGSDYCEDIDVYFKLNVILETTDMKSIINVCKIVCPEQLHYIDDELTDIIDTFTNYFKFYSKGKNNE